MNKYFSIKEQITYFVSFENKIALNLYNEIKKEDFQIRVKIYGNEKEIIFLKKNKKKLITDYNFTESEVNKYILIPIIDHVNKMFRTQIEFTKLRKEVYEGIEKLNLEELIYKTEEETHLYKLKTMNEEGEEITFLFKKDYYGNTELKRIFIEKKDGLNHEFTAECVKNIGEIENRIKNAKQFRIKNILGLKAL